MCILGGSSLEDGLFTETWLLLCLTLEPKDGDNTLSGLKKKTDIQDLFLRLKIPFKIRY